MHTKVAADRIMRNSKGIEFVLVALFARTTFIGCGLPVRNVRLTLAVSTAVLVTPRLRRWPLL